MIKNKCVWKFLITILLTAFNGNSLASHDKDMKFNHISLEDGLSQSAVNCILKDHIGFMWFGTQDGLNRFDGYKFKVLKYDPNNSNSISSNDIRCVCEDSSGKLWIGTETGGLNCYDPATNKNIRYLPNPMDHNSLSHNDATCVLIDKAGKLWVGTNGGGLNLLNKKTNNFTIYQHDKNDLSTISNDRILAICEDDSGFLWIATGAGGLNRFDTKTNKFKHYKHKPYNSNGLSSDNICSLFIDNDGTLWIGNYGGALDKFNPNTEQFEHYQVDTGDENSNKSLYIRAIQGDKYGYIWIATNGGGLKKLNPFTKQIDEYQYSPYNPNSIANSQLVSVLIDEFDNLWLGTYGNGIDYCNLVHKEFHLYRNDPKNLNSISSNEIWKIFEDSFGTIWIGTVLGVNIYDKEKNQFTRLFHNSNNDNSLSSNIILCICEDKNNDIWFGTSGYGIDKYIRETGRFIHYKHDPNNLSSVSDDRIRDIFKDSSGDMWIGTYGGGLDRFDYDTNQFINYRHNQKDENSLSDNYVLIIFEDRKNVIWVGSNNGLNRFNSQTNNFKRYKYDVNDNHSISFDKILTIHEDNYGNLWIGTQYGLNKFDYATERFTRYTQKDGLCNNFIYGILEDDNNNLWLSTNDGLCKFNHLTGIVRNYNESDGLQSDEFSYHSYCKTSTGEMYFGGIGGLNSFFPDSIKDDIIAPPVVITDFQIFNTSVPIGALEDGRILLDSSIFVTDEIILSHKDDVFSFEFSALHYRQPERNQYAYMLEGFEDHWNYINNRHFVTYTTLPPGKYTFRVKASNCDDVWNDEGASLKIIITPPFWQTYWFRSLIILLILCLMIISYYAKTYQIRKRNKLLEERVDERTNELRTANKKLKRIRNSLEKQVEKRTAEYRTANEELSQEIKDRKKIENSLRQNERYLQTVLDSIHTGVFIVDAESHKIIDANPMAMQMIGLPKEQIVNFSCHRFICPAEQDKCPISALKQKVDNSERILFNSDGDNIPVLKTIKIIELDGRKCFLESFVDISDAKRAEQALIEAKDIAEAANKAKSEFLANMSHEIRTPMNGIIGMTEIALDKNPTEQQKEYLTYIKQSSDSLLDIVNDILDFSEIESGNLELRHKNFHLLSLIEETLVTFAIQNKNNQVELLCDYGLDSALCLNNDPIRLRQILNKLIENAVNFTDNGEIVVRAKLNEFEKNTNQELILQFSVSDTGSGISEDKLAMIFEKFSQADSSFSRKHGGTGLGLSISKELVQKINGRIWVESPTNQLVLDSDLDLTNNSMRIQPGGPGSTFHFTGKFKIAEGSIPYNNKQEVKFKKEQILIINNNITNCRIIKKILTNLGLTVDYLNNCSDALSKIKNMQTNLKTIIIDNNLPDAEYTELVKKIRANSSWNAIKIIVLIPINNDVPSNEKLGIDGYLMKPVRQSELIQMMAKLLKNISIKDINDDKNMQEHIIEKLKILLVEDNIINQKVVMNWLNKWNYDVTVANNGKQAIDRLLSKQYFDLILMDIQMPEMDGVEATKIIRNSDSPNIDTQIPIIALTAHAMPGDREYYLSIGMNEYIPKPIDIEELKKAIEVYSYKRVEV